MPETNQTTFISFKKVNGQLIVIKEQEPTKVLTKAELSRMYITNRKIYESKCLWLAKIINGLSFLISKLRKKLALIYPKLLTLN